MRFNVFAVCYGKRGSNEEREDREREKERRGRRCLVFGWPKKKPVARISPQLPVLNNYYFESESVTAAPVILSDSQSSSGLSLLKVSRKMTSDVLFFFFLSLSLSFFETVKLKRRLLQN